jgi:hypothetical protein
LLLATHLEQSPVHAHAQPTPQHTNKRPSNAKHTPKKTTTTKKTKQIVTYLVHWVACGFYGFARAEGFDADALVGVNADLFTGASRAEQYLYALYWAVTTLAGNEFNGAEAVTDYAQVGVNAVRATVFLLFNLALGAYILGTLTLLVVKNDERTGR